MAVSHTMMYLISAQHVTYRMQTVYATSSKYYLTTNSVKFMQQTTPTVSAGDSDADN